MDVIFIFNSLVVELRDQMAETTKQINAMTGEYVAMKESAHHYDSLITSLQQENDRVRGLLEELVQDKKNKEKQMDQVEAEVEKRIGQMTDILEFKVSFVLCRENCRLCCLSTFRAGNHCISFFSYNKLK
jgi:regulator of replication initiation timing